MNIWSILILLGAIQGVVLAVALKGKNRPRANIYFSLFLLATSIHLIDYALATSQFILIFPHSFALSYPVLFMMGPFFYLYTQALFDSEFRFTRKHLLHFLPAGVVLLAFLPFYLLPTQDKLAFLQGLVSDGTLTIPTNQFIFMFAHMSQLLIYSILAARNLARKQRHLAEQFSSSAVGQFSWLRVLTLGFVTYAIVYLVMLLVLLNVEVYQVEIDYVVLLLTAVGIYAIGYKALRQPMLFDGLQLHGKVKRSLSTESISQIGASVEDYYQTERPYLNENLKLIDVAEALQVPAHQLSEAINETAGKSFFEYTNQYRIKEAKSILENPDNSKLKIIAVAYDTGFGNKATFNRVFKKSTGLTPSQYKLRHQAIGSI